MIKIKLSEQLGKRRMSRRELAQLIGVRPNTIGDMYNDNVKRLDITTLNKISIKTGNDGRNFIKKIPEDTQKIVCFSMMGLPVKGIN